MQPRQAAYLLDILKSAEAIQAYVGGQTLADFLKDPKTQDAVLRRLLVVGEAAGRLTPATREHFPAIPFTKIVGMRNRVVHDYGHVDVEIVWDIVQIHVPILRTELQRFFADSEP